jgi:hypothetical protein
MAAFLADPKAVLPFRPMPGCVLRRRQRYGSPVGEYLPRISCENLLTNLSFLFAMWYEQSARFYA